MGNILLMLMLVMSLGCGPALHIVGKQGKAWRRDSFGAPNSPPVPMRGHGGDGARLLTAAQGGRAKDSEHKLEQGRFRLGIGRNCFPMRTVRQWSRSLQRLCHPLPWKVSSPDWTKP